MGIIRNFIDVIGITPEDKLPERAGGQIIEYSEVENIFIPDSREKIKSIHQITVKVDIKSNRIINSPQGKIVVLDGIKRFKIMYKEKGKCQKINIISLKVPYNTFVEIPKDKENIKKIELYVADAYFDLVDSTKIYSHILYMLDITFNEKKAKTEHANASDFTYEIGKEYVFDEISITNQLKQSKGENQAEEVENEYLNYEDEYL